MQHIIGALAFLLLVACSGPQPVLERPAPSAAEPPPSVDYFNQRCRAYGYEPGTDEMTECLQREELDYRIRPKPVG